MGGDVSVKLPFVLMRDGPEASPLTLDTADDTYQTNRSPERPSSPVGLEHATDFDDAINADKNVDGVPLPEEWRENLPVERVDADLHPEPKLPISDEPNSINEPQLPTHSGSSSNQVEPNDDDVVAR